jgi:hypothetical protein
MNTNHIVFSVTDLLRWAYDETKLADMLEKSGLAGPMAEEIEKHRRRSRWLDEQAAVALEKADPSE